MWAQVQRVSTAPDKEAQVLDIFDRLAAIEQEDSGLLQTLVLRSQTDPSDVFVVVVFESEEKARARESDPRRQEPLQQIRAAMGDALSGPPEFFDCTVLVNR
jgi:heme-degrading monooxygenase HmoA